MHFVPSSPGIYVVSLSNEQPLSVNADRAFADRCIFVTKANCKFGRAQDLARRYRDYVKTFGPEHVTFEVVVLTDSPAQLEAAVSARLSDFRVRGRTGRPNEWLVGTTPSDVKRIILEVAAQQPVPARSKFEAPAETLVQPSPLRPAVITTEAHASPAEVVEAASYLKAAGMPVRLLKDLHHFSARTETYSSTIRYFSSKRELRPVNIAYGARLRYVAQAHSKSGAPFESLVAEALARFPLSTDA